MTSSTSLRIFMAGFYAVLFVFTCKLAAAQQEQLLYTFTGGTDGGRPIGSLTVDAAGNLYGTTTGGGRYGGGVVFRLSSSAGSWNYSVLHNFGGGSDGSVPTGKLVFDAAGNLYGSTPGGAAQGCGTVYQLSPTAGGIWNESLIYTFTCGSDGGSPQAGVVLDKTGNLYGTNFVGGDLTACGAQGCGTVFALRPNYKTLWDFVVLHAFQDADGGNPEAGVTLEGAGNLFGTTLGFGAAGWGTVYELSPDAQGEQTRFRLLHTFALLKDGGNPGGAGWFSIQMVMHMEARVQVAAEMGQVAERYISWNKIPADTGNSGPCTPSSGITRAVYHGTCCWVQTETFTV